MTGKKHVAESKGLINCNGIGTGGINELLKICYFLLSKAVPVLVTTKICYFDTNTLLFKKF